MTYTTWLMIAWRARHNNLGTVQYNIVAGTYSASEHLRRVGYQMGLRSWLRHNV